MQRVCTAVQHAHQRGIIHRDLKPSNVLVTLVDAEAVPKVIDFGVARAIEQDALVHTLATVPGQLIGTPEYMSPEQASLRPGAVGTETDVYALGLILYELLVGALPFDLAAFRKAGFDEMCRIAREADAPKPSARSGAIARPEEAARARGTHPFALAKRLRGELDWIVLKALEKEPARRYASAAELGADLARVLHHEPVAAGPPSAAYRSRKFVRKHRVAVAAVSLVVLVLAATTAVSTRLYLRAEAARLEAERRRDESEHRAYRTNILAADLSLAAGEVREARRLLDVTPDRLRGCASTRLETLP
jgi:non-specific serine/threonine protein kinase/serine/threonine-protein kinase